MFIYVVAFVFIFWTSYFIHYVDSWLCTRKEKQQLKQREENRTKKTLFCGDVRVLHGERGAAAQATQCMAKITRTNGYVQTEMILKSRVPSLSGTLLLHRTQVFQRKGGHALLRPLSLSTSRQLVSPNSSAPESEKNNRGIHSLLFLLHKIIGTIDLCNYQVFRQEIGTIELHPMFHKIPRAISVCSPQVIR